MIAERVEARLLASGAAVERHSHDHAVTAQELAERLGVSGYQVAKTVLVEADDQTWIGVFPAPEVVDLQRLANALGARKVRFLGEEELAPLFPDCDAGAEPPLGSVYGLPVIVDADLAEEARIVFRAGSHDESISMRYEDFARLENPLIADFSVPRPALHPSPQPGA